MTDTAAPSRHARYAIAVIVLAELFGTSLWFSTNAVADALLVAWGVTAVDLGHLTSAVQLGFIVGTLLFALSGLADRFSASRIFAVCAVVGALTNAAFALAGGDFTYALLLRFLTGVSLAGVYPIGMKLVVSWAPDKIGSVLGWLVGMLVLGTGLAHFIRGIEVTPTWQGVIYTASGLALLAAAFGYFGHMWELYAFWALVPLLIAQLSPAADGHRVYLAAFGVFVAGGLGCVLGGMLSRRWGSGRVAITALAGSASMCLVYPLAQAAPYPLVMTLLLAWGFFVVADSPQFSALAAKACPPDRVGGALALMNSFGFAITIVAIEASTALWQTATAQVAWLLLPGPVLGLVAMRRMWRN